MSTRRGRKPSDQILGGPLKGKKVPSRARPFPEIIDEQDWEVREGRYPSFIKRSKEEGKPHLMQVPLGETDIDRKIRLHEQAHVTWTNLEEYEDNEDVQEKLGYLHDVETLWACEDGRIIEKMGRARQEWKELNATTVGMLTPQMQSAFQDGFGRLAAHLRGEKEAKASGKAAPKAPDKMMHLVEAARLIASTRGYAEGKIFDDIATSAGLGWVKDEVQKMHKEFIASKEDPTILDTLDYALYLEEFFFDKQQQIEETNEAMAEMGANEIWGEGANQGQAAKPVYTPPTKEQGKNSKARTIEKMGNKPKREHGTGSWGQLTIVHKPLTEKLAARDARRPRPSDVGAVPRYMHRLLTDQRVFGRRRKKKSFEGTVLIDCSGSMRLTGQDVDDILTRWPAVTVATYAGDVTTGELWIIASKGKRARKGDLMPAFGGNVVDGPCLDWLAKQKMPRVWISDGGVTGVGEAAFFDFVADAARKMKRGKIKRLANVQALLRGDKNEEYRDYAERY